jgi:type II secretory pathway pseudopilin PulG
MLIVIGIIVVLATLLVPTVIRTVRQGTRAAMAADLQAIATALEAYKQDHGDYPRVAKNPAWSNGDYYALGELAPNPPTGAQILCQALMGPAEATGTANAGRRPVQDGNNGYGFRVRPGGQVFGPYLRVGQFRIGDPENLDPATLPTNPPFFKMCLLDRNDQPILYYPARPGPRTPGRAG